MTQRLALVLALVVLALVAVPVAAGDGPAPFAQQAGPGVLLPAAGKSGPLRFVAVPASGGADTVLETIQTNDGQIRGWFDVSGSYGIPTINWSQGGDSLSRNGRTLVLGKVQPGSPSAFLIFDPKTFRLKQRIALPGSFVVRCAVSGRGADVPHPIHAFGLRRLHPLRRSRV
jgi:hypothetical protein